MHNENSDNKQNDDAITSVKARKAVRKRRFAFFFGLVGLVAIAAAVWWWFSARFYEETDDAYVAGNIVQVSAQIPGTVSDILVENTQHVHLGETLVKLDETEVAVAFAQAKAQLAQAVRQARGAALANTLYAEQVKAREAELAVARRALAARDHASVEVVSPEEAARAGEAVAVAQANLAAARAQLAGSRLPAGQSPVVDDPMVVQAAEQLRLAYANYQRASIVSPIEGTVAQRTVQMGQRVGPGVPLMSIIPLDRLWVEANFKEGQIRNMRVGQPVRVISDVYGSQVVYHGHVRGFSAGTGSAFSMLPPQNATGNWIKVVQRVPIMIDIDASDLAAHPLRLGLSMQVRVDTHERNGRLVSMQEASAERHPGSQDDGKRLADGLISKIIGENR